MPKPSVGALLPQGYLALSHLCVPSLFPRVTPLLPALSPNRPAVWGCGRGITGKKLGLELRMLPSLFPELALLDEDSDQMGLGSADGLWGAMLGPTALAQSPLWLPPAFPITLGKIYWLQLTSQPLTSASPSPTPRSSSPCLSLGRRGAALQNRCLG